MPQSWDMGQILLLTSGVRHAEDSYARKNPTASAGFELEYSKCEWKVSNSSALILNILRSNFLNLRKTNSDIQNPSHFPQPGCSLVNERH